MQLKAEAATCKYSYRKHGYNYFYLNGAVSLPTYQLYLIKSAYQIFLRKKKQHKNITQTQIWGEAVQSFLENAMSRKPKLTFITFIFLKVTLC